MRVYMLALLLLFSALCTGQYNIFDTHGLQNNGHAAVTPNCSYITDTSGLLSVTQVAAMAKNGGAFAAALGKAYTNFGYPAYPVWFKVTLANTDSLPNNFFMVLLNHLGYQFDLWQDVGGTISYAASTGRKFTFKQRPYSSGYYIFPCSMAAHQVTTYYIRADARGTPFTFGLVLLSDKEVRHNELIVYFFMGILSGILLLAALFNCYLFFATKEWIHLYYSAYVICAWLLVLSLEGYDFQFFYPQHPKVIVFVRIASSVVAVCLLVHVMQLFVGQLRTNSKFYTTNTYYKAIMLLLVIPAAYLYYHPFNYTLSAFIFKFDDIGLVVGFLLVIASCIEKIRQGVKIAIFYLIAVSTVCIGAIGFIIKALGFDDISTFSPARLSEAGMGMEVMIVSFGIFYRYNQYKKQKEQLESNLLLVKIESVKQIIRAEEEERRRIARDLHDDVSGTLSALRFFVSSRLKNETNVIPGADKSFRATIIEIMGKLAQDIRNVSHNLMPNDFDTLGLNELLDEKILFLNQNQDIVFELICKANDARYTREQKLSIYRCISELVQNVVKHSGATKCTIQILAFDNYTEFQISDDGSGFDEHTVKRGIGIANIKSRVGLLEGSITIDSNKFGTLVIFTIPSTPINEKHHA